MTPRLSLVVLCSIIISRLQVMQAHLGVPDPVPCDARPKTVPFLASNALFHLMVSRNSAVGIHRERYQLPRACGSPG